ncbi:inositol 5-phosphatase [Tieghemostelium lacteum]|uniref:Inositol 5-phosphatase n=1 Tax=Tieghemostelium lacteum TaxID=361077 RepID=A0A151ZRU4_TIELA|nr:inositol 5-phosphatase [Tieghemostelium lacteum]|eukprot:KYQ96666.1 inositol 5-phosphatase [Tieghemostelium lacteum]
MKILYTWGKGKSGNTCHNIDKKYPSAPSVLLSLNIEQISMGSNHSAAIVNNECLMWGEVMGRKHTTLFKIVWKKKVDQVSCGFNHTLLLTNEHKIYAMGINQLGQLGIENAVDSAVPIPIESLNSKYNLIKIVAGNQISAAITEQGDLYTWGNNQYGQLANGKVGVKSNQCTPSTIQPPLYNSAQEQMVYQNLQWSQIVFGQSHVLAITTTGILFVWGGNQDGQLGLGHTNPKYIPVRCSFIDGAIITDISCGLNHSALLTLDGDVYMWGSNEFGQIGQGDQIEHSYSPIRVKGDLEYKRVTRIALGSNHSLVLTKEQDIYSFGANESHQLGHGAHQQKKPKYTPTLIQKPRIKAIDIFAAGDCSALFEIVNNTTLQTHSIDSSLLNGNTTSGSSLVNTTGILGGASGGGNILGKKFNKNNLTIFVGSWNCNGKRSMNLGNWLLSNSFSADIVAIGLQEIVDMKASAIVKATAEDKKNNKENAYHPWKHDIEQTLSLSTGRYVKVLNKVLVGLMLLVYVKEEHAPFVYDTCGSVVPCGVMGKIGNKGAVGVRFTLYQTGICFVNSHLAAGPSNERNERRAADFKKIQMMTFENHISMLDHESLIWFGDLNYRIDLPQEEAKALVHKKNYQQLQQYDQLNNERKSGKAFIGFNEEPLNFQPTYKYDVGTSTYDTSEKNRTPSWCDRILYRGDSLKQINYSRHELKESDHRPISAIFLLEIKHYIPNGKGWNLNNNLLQNVLGTGSASSSPGGFQLNGSASKITIGSTANQLHQQQQLQQQQQQQQQLVSPDVRSSSSPQLPTTSNSVIYSTSYSSTTSTSSTASSSTSSSVRNLPSLPLPPLPPKIKKKDPFIIGSLPNHNHMQYYLHSHQSSLSKKRLSYSHDDINGNNSNNSRNHSQTNGYSAQLHLYGSYSNSPSINSNLLSNHRKIKNSLDLPSLLNSNGSIDINAVLENTKILKEQSEELQQHQLQPQIDNNSKNTNHHSRKSKEINITNNNNNNNNSSNTTNRNSVIIIEKEMVSYNNTDDSSFSGDSDIPHEYEESFLDSSSDDSNSMINDNAYGDLSPRLAIYNSAIHLEDLPLNFNLIDSDAEDDIDMDLKDLINENYINISMESIPTTTISTTSTTTTATSITETLLSFDDKSITISNISSDTSLNHNNNNNNTSTSNYIDIPTTTTTKEPKDLINNNGHIITTPNSSVESTSSNTVGFSPSSFKSGIKSSIDSNSSKTPPIILGSQRKK